MKIEFYLCKYHNHLLHVRKQVFVMFVCLIILRRKVLHFTETFDDAGNLFSSLPLCFQALQQVKIICLRSIKAKKNLRISVYSNRHFLSSMNNGYVIRLMTSDVRSYIIIFVSFYIITFFSPFLMIWFLAFFTPKLHRVFFQGGRNLGNLAQSILANVIYTAPSKLL